MTQERRCECGCGELVTGMNRGRARRFVTHHNLRVQGERTLEHRAKLGDAQRQRVWGVKRPRRALGSTHRNVNGYLLEKIGPGAKDWRLQHHLVAERQLGRPLRDGEHVHHINAVRSDNRPENLHVFASGKAHALAHGSLEGLLAFLLDSGIVRFNPETERYELA